jgi:hypothetical protein
VPHGLFDYKGAYSTIEEARARYKALDSGWGQIVIVADSGLLFTVEHWHAGKLDKHPEKWN